MKTRDQTPKRPRPKLTPEEQDVILMSGTLPPLVAPPPSNDPFAGVRASTLAQRQAIIDTMKARMWRGYTGQAIQTTVTITSAATIEATFNSRSRADLSAWHEIVLDSAQPAANWAAGCEIRGYAGNANTGVPEAVVVLGHLFGSTWDRASAGGGVLIRSSDPNNPVTFYGGIFIRGVRGVEFQDVRFARESPLPTSASRDASVACSIISGTTSNPEAIAVRFRRCKFGLAYHPAPVNGGNVLYAGVCISQSGPVTAQVDTIDCVFDKGQTGIKGAGIAYYRDIGSDYQNIIGDERIPLATSVIGNYNTAYGSDVYHYVAKGTSRNKADVQEISLEHADDYQLGTSLDLSSYFSVKEFTIQQAERLTCNDQSDYNFSGQPADLSTITFGGTTFTFKSAPAGGTDIQIGASLAATLNNATAVINANLPASVNRASNTSTVIKVLFIQDQWTVMTRSVAPAANCTVVAPIRVSGGTQGDYNDDSTLTMTVVRISNLYSGSDGIDATVFNGTGYIDRCDGVRPQLMAPDAELAIAGFNYSNDFEPYYTSGRINAAMVVNHFVFNSRMTKVRDNPGGGVFRTANGVYLASDASLTIDGCEFVEWAEGTAGPGTHYAGPFALDAQNRWRYTVQNDGLNSQADFRAGMYANFTPAGVGSTLVGITDPAIWPTTEECLAYFD